MKKRRKMNASCGVFGWIALTLVACGRDHSANYGSDDLQPPPILRDNLEAGETPEPNTDATEIPDTSPTPCVNPTGIPVETPAVTPTPFSTPVPPGEPESTEPPDTAPTSSENPILWGEGHLHISGTAYFINVSEDGELSWDTDVYGAEVYVVEEPELRVTLDPDHLLSFRIDGIPEGVQVTLALEHARYFPTMTATLQIRDQPIEGVTFQAVNRSVTSLASNLLGIDLSDESLCHMATTVTAIGGDSVWAVGEPGATVSITPEISGEYLLYYFNNEELPSQSLTTTTSDGKVLVIGAEPGWYTWTARKEGVQFNEVTMRCVGGWLTNASPPWGVNVIASNGDAAMN